MMKVPFLMRVAMTMNLLIVLPQPPIIPKGIMVLIVTMIRTQMHLQTRIRRFLLRYILRNSPIKELSLNKAHLHLRDGNQKGVGKFQLGLVISTGISGIPLR